MPRRLQQVCVYIHCVSKKAASNFSNKGGKKYYIYFVDNLLLFPTVKEFSKSVNIS